MFRWLLLLILIMPAVEIGILIWAGNLVGPWWVILLIIATGVIGAWLAKQQGLETIRKIQEAASRGEAPGDALLDGACILVGGAFLLTPGFVSDTIGFVLLIPSTRRPLKGSVRKLIVKLTNKNTITIYRR
ncbi:FxsA family protein [Halobacillus sp. Marseille-Q1614]|uniref:FxsA family protein n=1 Tax=Halobacillus sp. Marseille-Q1614 TaxID=2709134 RepID=UPI00157082CA|nr:FxsA family protein [Halobacillus sp. Marseille-Q1614]